MVAVSDDVTPALTDGHNMAVLGSTQTGKTAFVRELHATTDRVSIWLNERGDDRVPNIEGRTCRTLEDVREAFAADCWRIEFVPADRRESLPELRRWLWRVAEATDRSLPMQVVADEIDRLAEQTGERDVPSRDAWRTLTSEGVKRGVKAVGITQHPQQYDKECLRNSRYRAVFQMSNEAFQSVSKYGFDRDAVAGAERYAGVLHHMNGSVLGEIKASEEYAK